VTVNEKLSASCNAPIRLERKVLLGEITERNHNDSGEHLGNCRIYMEVLYEQLDENIIQEYAKHYQQEVAEQLDTAA
jgi:hypothetical protein